MLLCTSPYLSMSVQPVCASVCPPTQPAQEDGTLEQLRAFHIAFPDSLCLASVENGSFRITFEQVGTAFSGTRSRRSRRGCILGLK